MRPVSSRTRRRAWRASSSSTSKCVTAARGASVSSDRRTRSWRSRPIGASIVPRRDRGRPTTSARYSRSIARSRTSSWSRSCASVGACDDEQSGRVAVEPVHDPGALFVAALGPRGEQPGHERPRSMPRRGVDDDAGRLVDHDEVLVFVGDRQVDLLRRDPGRLRSRQRELQLLPTRESVALRSRAAVDEDGALREKPLRERARADRREVREVPVQPRAGRPVSDAQARHGRGEGVAATGRPPRGRPAGCPRRSR